MSTHDTTGVRHYVPGDAAGWSPTPADIRTMSAATPAPSSAARPSRHARLLAATRTLDATGVRPAVLDARAASEARRAPPHGRRYTRDAATVEHVEHVRASVAALDARAVALAAIVPADRAGRREQRAALHNIARERAALLAGVPLARDVGASTAPTRGASGNPLRGSNGGTTA